MKPYWQNYFKYSAQVVISIFFPLLNNLSAKKIYIAEKKILLLAITELYLNNNVFFLCIKNNLSIKIYKTHPCECLSGKKKKLSTKEVK